MSIPIPYNIMPPKRAATAKPVTVRAGKRQRASQTPSQDNGAIDL
jgi:hypothetical protein